VTLGLKGEEFVRFMKDRIASGTGASGHDRTFARQHNIEKGVATTLRNTMNNTPKDMALVFI